MKSINIRELTHHFSSYLKIVKKGERITVMERNKPVADIIPHNANVIQPSWKRPIQRISIKGGSLSKTVLRMREEENY